MTMLVSGGSGFIGSHVVDALVQAGYPVRVMDMVQPHRKDVEYSTGSITHSADVKVAAEGVSHIFHLAAVSNVDEAFQEPAKTVEVNVGGTLNVLEAARKADCDRVLFASTVWVYGGARGVDVNEDSPFYMPGAGHVYTSTKIACELLLHDYWELYGVPFTVLRYGIPYGPRARSGTVIPIFLRKALAGEPLTIFGDGSQYRNFVYVEDLAVGNVKAVAPVAENQTYNLEGPRPITVLEVAETIRKLLGGKVQIEYKPARSGDYRGKIVSAEKAWRELGWRPTIEFEEGMRRYLEWFQMPQQTPVAKTG